MTKSLVDIESLPQELKDLIVDHIAQIPNESERLQALCSTALVSRRFRYWAHKRLFATIMFRGKYGKPTTAIVERMCQLRDLIYADPESEKTGIASHIRSFTLSVGGPKATVLLPVDDKHDALPDILRKLHLSGSRPRSVSILLFMPGDNDQLDWTGLRNSFRRALFAVCRSPLLSTLRLRGLKNLPRTILTGSFLENIKFNNISIAESLEFADLPTPPSDDGLFMQWSGEKPNHLSSCMRSDELGAQSGSRAISTQIEPFEPEHSKTCGPWTVNSEDSYYQWGSTALSSTTPPYSDSARSDVQAYPDFIQLESIETDLTFPLADILDLTHTRSHPQKYIFQKLRSLTLSFKSPDSFEKASLLLENTPNIDKLEIKLNCINKTKYALSFLSLSNIKHLRLIHRLHTPIYSTLSSIASHAPHPTVQDMINLLTYAELPKNLKRISITLSVKPPYIEYGPQATNAEAGAETELDGRPEDENILDGQDGFTRTGEGVDTSINAAGPSRSMLADNTSVLETSSRVENHNAPGSKIVKKSTTTTKAKSTRSCSQIIPLKTLFAHASQVFEPLDKLLGLPIQTPHTPSSSSAASHPPPASATPSLSAPTLWRDPFAEVNYFTIRLELDLYLVPKEFTKQHEKEFVEEAGDYVRKEFFPRLRERTDRDEVAKEAGSGTTPGFGVVITPRYRIMNGSAN